jgi:hypothetical protein
MENINTKPHVKETCIKKPKIIIKQKNHVFQNFSSPKVISELATKNYVTNIK